MQGKIRMLKYSSICCRSEDGGRCMAFEIYHHNTKWLTHCKFQRAYFLRMLKCSTLSNSSKASLSSALWSKSSSSSLITPAITAFPNPRFQPRTWLSPFQSKDKASCQRLHCWSTQTCFSLTKKGKLSVSNHYSIHCIGPSPDSPSLALKCSGTPRNLVRLQLTLSPRAKKFLTTRLVLNT